MKPLTSVSTFCLLLSLAAPASAQSEVNPAMNSPDAVAWELLIGVTKAADGGKATFETFASDSDTFVMSPKYPAGVSTLKLHPRILPAIAHETALRNGVMLPALPPDTNLSLEETRRNRPAFDFIVSNNLYKVTGLKAAFGRSISFPLDSIEVKANWVPVDKIPQFTKGQVHAADVPKLYHVSSDGAGRKYALVAIHLISKEVPNWTWATFEHRYNPGRCDVIGCSDFFGSQLKQVPPNSTPGQTYTECVKTPELKALFSAAGSDPVYGNYCLKGSQADFVDNTGLDIRLGNSVTEDGFVPTSSCMTCHGRAAFGKDGLPTSAAGFVNPNVTPPIGPLGPLQPTWYWNFNGQPPIYEGMPGLNRTATSADFVWSIPLCAVDDTQTPPQTTACLGK